MLSGSRLQIGIMNQHTCLDEIKTRIIKHFEIPYSFNRIHGSNYLSFENIAFCIGNNQDSIMDDEITSFYEFYLRKFRETDEIMSSDFVRTMLLNCMLYMGKKINIRDEVLVESFQERLNRVYNFTRSGERIFYTDEEKKQIKSVPPVWKNAGIVRYEHTNPYLRLPIVYDLLGFSAMYGANKELDDKINQILAYIFSDSYQEEVELGYGIGINGERGFVKSSFYAVGWDVCLSHLSPRQEFLYMILLSFISSAKETEWYKKNLDKYQRALEAGDNEFLSLITSSIRKTYWTSGCFLDFGHSKEKKIDRMIELINRLAV